MVVATIPGTPEPRIFLESNVFHRKINNLDCMSWLAIDCAIVAPRVRYVCTVSCIDSTIYSIHFMRTTSHPAIVDLNDNLYRWSINQMISWSNWILFSRLSIHSQCILYRRPTEMHSSWSIGPPKYRSKGTIFLNWICDSILEYIMHVWVCCVCRLWFADFLFPQYQYLICLSCETTTENNNETKTKSKLQFAFTQNR